MEKENFDELFKEILKLESIDECRKFFDDLCTMKELESMTQRIKAAKMILDGKTFVEVIEETKISSATLSRVSKCIKYGDNGYKTIIEKDNK